MVNFDYISYEIAAKCKANSKHLGLGVNGHLPKMIYKNPKQIIDLLEGLTQKTIEMNANKIYLFQHEQNSDLFALFDSESGLTENDVYDFIFSENDSCTGIYVREVMGLDAVMPSLLAVLKGTRKL